MSKTCEMIAIPLGYKICEEVTFVDAFMAFNNILAGEKQFKYTDAEIISNENMVKLTEHFAVCPNCGQHTPAYKHYVYGFKPQKCFTRQDAQLWSTEVMSLFETENKKIDLYKPISDKDTFKCMHCSSESKSNDKKVFLSFIKEPHKITIIYPIRNIGDIVRINWTKKLLSIDEFPIYESVTFNFKRGTTHLALKTASGKLLVARDISRGVDDLNFSSPIINLLSKNVLVKRKLKKMFAGFWMKPLPFREHELDIQKFSLATAFIGYDDALFYSYIPYKHKTKVIDASYKKTYKLMHCSDNIASVYKQSILPDMKSIKKRVFNNPVLFFYLKELETLWESTNKEPNFFCALLDSEHVYGILRFLHDFPSAFKLYADMCNAGLYVPFKEMLLKFPREVNEYALVYASFNEQKRQEAKRKLERSLCKSLRFSEGVSSYFFSIPDRATINSIQTQIVRDYLFTPLKSMNEYIVAGEQLENCLGEAEFDTPIVGVLQSGRYIAAIQVDVENNLILQAYMKNNRNIDTDERFYAAFKKWCKKNNYDYHEELFYDY